MINMFLVNCLEFCCGIPIFLLLFSLILPAFIYIRVLRQFTFYKSIRKFGCKCMIQLFDLYLFCLILVPLLLFPGLSEECVLEFGVLNPKGPCF